MKYILFQLTIFFSILPFVNNHFNSLVRFNPIHCPSNSSFNITHSHKECNKVSCFFTDTDVNTTILPAPDFGSEMGTYIKENIFTDDGYAIKTVVIDPGHGGRDGGTSGKYVVEKDIALNIALRLGSSIKGNYPDIRVIYTRTSDVFIKLDERSDIANRNKADLFISIHCNFLEDGGRVNGSETYVMGLHKATENLNVAKRENASILYEQNYQQTYGGYDPNSPEGHIILSMYQNAYLDQSIQLADKIESNIAGYARKKSRGVKQAGFVVLKQTTMPSVLVETGYLSNTKDEQFLSSDAGQSSMAISILKAFSEYKKEVENNNYINQQTITAYQQPIIKRTNTDYEPAQSRKAKKGMSPSLLVKSQELSSSATDAIQYKVLLKSSNNRIDTSRSPWKNVSYSIQVLQEGDAYKYLVIGFKSYDSAVEAKNKLRKQGFGEAFVVAYQNGKRVKIASYP